MRARRTPWRVALTGGIASGKSTVGALFQALGVPLVDLDRIARDVVAPGTALLGEVAQRFGDDILMHDGALDRSRLRRLVFADAAARRDLEALLHPAIRAAAESQAESARAPYVMLAIPLLVEGREPLRHDRVLLVDCDEAVQLARLQVRDGAPLEEARAILAAQASRAARHSLADDIIVNDGPIAALVPQVERLHLAYLDHAGRARTGAGTM